MAHHEKVYQAFYGKGIVDTCIRQVKVDTKLELKEGVTFDLSLQNGGTGARTVNLLVERIDGAVEQEVKVEFELCMDGFAVPLDIKLVLADIIEKWEDFDERVNRALEQYLKENAVLSIDMEDEKHIIFTLIKKGRSAFVNTARCTEQEMEPYIKMGDSDI